MVYRESLDNYHLMGLSRLGWRSYWDRDWDMADGCTYDTSGINNCMEIGARLRVSDLNTSHRYNYLMNILLPQFGQTQIFDFHHHLLPQHCLSLTSHSPSPTVPT